MSKFHKFIKIIVTNSLYRFHSYMTHKISYRTNLSPKLRLNHIGMFAFISWLTKTNKEQLLDSKKHFDVESQISKSIQQAEELLRKGDVKEAKLVLNEAIQIADANQAYEMFSYLCDLLLSILLTEGEIYEAESMLVKFIERFLQLGYQETHNIIVTFKLKLARINQLLGSFEMAEYGFRDCIQVQEKKLHDQKQLDEISNEIYLTALFWYGKLLADQEDFNRARKQYKTCWERISKSKGILPSLKMVVLHSIANVSARLKNFDEALHYLYTGIEICLVEDPQNADLPIFVVQVGWIFFQKELYESASSWCQAGYELASQEGNELATKEGQKCIDELKKLKILP